MSEVSLRLLLSALDGTKHGVDEVAESWALCESKVSCATACVPLRRRGSVSVVKLLFWGRSKQQPNDLRRKHVHLTCHNSRRSFVAGCCATRLMELPLLRLWSCQKRRRGFRPF